jgi:hypothetical protein
MFTAVLIVRKPLSLLLVSHSLLTTNLNYTFFVRLKGNIIKVLFAKEWERLCYERIIDYVAELKVGYKPIKSM